MRDIKFRAWCETEKHMYNWNNLLNQNLKNIFTITKSCGYNLMQYTGLKDKNGKEIYEGDIIEWTTHSGHKYKFSVKYSNKYAQYIIVNTKGISMEYEPLGDFENIEVIGNIYNNPELLEEKE